MAGLTWSASWICQPGLAPLTIMTTVLCLRSEIWIIAFCAMMGYTAYYLLFLWTASWYIPGFFSIWNGYVLSGIRLLGMPVEEVLWIVTFSGMWSSSMA